MRKTVFAIAIAGLMLAGCNKQGLHGILETPIPSRLTAEPPTGSTGVAGVTIERAPTPSDDYDPEDDASRLAWWAQNVRVYDADYQPVSFDLNVRLGDGRGVRMSDNSDFATIDGLPSAGWHTIVLSRPDGYIVGVDYGVRSTGETEPFLFDYLFGQSAPGLVYLGMCRRPGGDFDSRTNFSEKVVLPDPDLVIEYILDDGTALLLASDPRVVCNTTTDEVDRIFWNGYCSEFPENLVITGFRFSVTPVATNGAAWTYPPIGQVIPLVRPLVAGTECGYWLAPLMRDPNAEAILSRSLQF